MMPQKFVEFEKFEQKCDRLLELDEIRFAGLINKMGRLVAGGFKKGITPLEDDAERMSAWNQSQVFNAFVEKFTKTIKEGKNAQLTLMEKAGAQLKRII